MAMKLEDLFRFGRRRRRRTLDQVSEYATVVGADSVFVGSLSGKDNYIVYGQVMGDCNLDGTIVVAAGGRWKGDIHATNVIIAGELAGTVTARTKLELAATARLRGDITSPVIAMAEGAAYDGQIRMKDSQVVRYNERRDRPKTENGQD